MRASVLNIVDNQKFWVQFNHHNIEIRVNTSATISSDVRYIVVIDKKRCQFMIPSVVAISSCTDMGGYAGIDG